MMDYAVLVTRRPAAVDTRTIDGLRSHGWDDADILTATEIIGFFNYYARMADALGIEPEDFMARDPETWSREGARDGDATS